MEKQIFTIEKSTVIDLFCGCGGLSLGFKNAGFHVIGYDIWEEALKTYEYNIGECYRMDLSVDAPEIHDDVIGIIGAPPCIEFSLAGTYVKVRTGDMTLVKRFFKIVRENGDKIKFWLMENVPQIKNFGLENLLKPSEFFLIMDCSQYGLPQVRKRAFASNMNFIDKMRKERPVTVMEAINNIPEHVPNHEKARHSPKFIERLKSTKQGEHVYNFNQSYKRLFPDRLSWTVTDDHGGRFIHPIENRMLTVREMARLQGFPDDFKFFGNKMQQFKQVANAVPPPIAYKIATSLSKM